MVDAIVSHDLVQTNYARVQPTPERDDEPPAPEVGHS